MNDNNQNTGDNFFGSYQNFTQNEDYNNTQSFSRLINQFRNPVFSNTSHQNNENVVDQELNHPPTEETYFEFDDAYESHIYDELDFNF